MKMGLTRGVVAENKLTCTLEFPTLFAELGGWNVLAVFFLNLQFINRQTVAILARRVRWVEACQSFGFYDDILQHLVQGMADVNFAVGIQWTVVQNEVFLLLLAAQLSGSAAVPAIAPASAVRAWRDIRT